MGGKSSKLERLRPGDGWVHTGHVHDQGDGASDDGLKTEQPASEGWNEMT